MPEDDVERVRAALGDRAARSYRGVTDLRQTHIGDYNRDGGAIPR